MNALPARLARKIEPVEGGCWLWRGHIGTAGYGETMWRGRKRSAHRVIYELLRGPIPVAPGYHGACVCHTCDVRACVSPAHLFVGTQLDNMRDRELKGRGADHRGVRNGRARLNPDAVRAIRASDDSLGELSARFGVAEQTISHVLCGRTWKHVT